MDKNSRFKKNNLNRAKMKYFPPAWVQKENKWINSKVRTIVKYFSTAWIQRYLYLILSYLLIKSGQEIKIEKKNLENWKLDIYHLHKLKEITSRHGPGWCWMVSEGVEVKVPDKHHMKEQLIGEKNWWFHWSLDWH